MNKSQASFPKTEKRIAQVCDEIKKLLISKNRAYGDSAINPLRVFSHADPMEQIRVRLDDKLSRIAQAKGTADPFGEDVEKDLLGYLILHRVARTQAGPKSKRASRTRKA